MAEFKKETPKVIQQKQKENNGGFVFPNPPAPVIPPTEKPKRVLPPDDSSNPPKENPLKRFILLVVGALSLLMILKTAKSIPLGIASFLSWLLVVWSGNINTDMVIGAFQLESEVLCLASAIFHWLIPLLAPAMGFEVYRKIVSENIQKLDRSKLLFVASINLIIAGIASFIGLLNGRSILNQIIWFILCNLVLALFYTSVEFFARSLKSK